jgi:DNA polymerase-3 subunit delta'
MIYPWQQQEWQTLLRSANSDRIPHAFLFAGMQGIGKLALAEHFAQLILCQQPKPIDAPCEKCHGCRLFLTKAHPDALWLLPEKEGSAIKIDQIRELTDFIAQSALQGKYRTVIINPANSMNLNAANALLKTLEEPTAGAIIILISDQPAQLPATILSRCHKLLFSRPSTEQAILWLKTQIKDSSEKLTLLLNLANGAPLAAVKLTNEDGLSVRHDIFNTLISLIMKKGDPLKAAAQCQALELLTFIDLSLSFIVDVIQLQVGNNRVVNQDIMKELITVKDTSNMQNNVKWMNALQAARSKIGVGVNFNKQLLLERLFIELG